MKKSEINELKRDIEKFSEDHTPEEQKQMIKNLDDDLKESATKILQKMTEVLSQEL